MILRQLFDTSSSSYSYLLADAGEAVLIDPILEKVDRDAALISELGLRLVYAIDTHVHADHVTGGGQLRKRLGCRQVAPAIAAVACADVHVHDGDALRFGDTTLRVLATPGHTAGCTSWHEPAGGRVFTGDTLLVRTCGRTDFQGGDAGTLYDSVLTKLFTLPDQTVVCPAHDYRGFTSTTIAEEKKFNARLARRTREEFIELMAKLNLPMPKRIAEALPANMQCGCPDEAIAEVWP
jgi:glyoxylase-like metal-dependent hydrolase (beta-lactamase superfamily II)